MKDEYDFSKGKRGPAIPSTLGKTRITIRVDDTILEWFRKLAEESRGATGGYQTMINDALHEYIRANGGMLESTVRRVVREELAGVGLAKVQKRRRKA